MGITRLVILSCDGRQDEDCELEPRERFALADLPDTVAEAVAIAREAGWVRTRAGLWFCPSCRK